MKKGLIHLIILFFVCAACNANERTVNQLKDKPHPTGRDSSYKVLRYLYKISGSKTIAGIHNREPNATPARWTEEMKNTTGKYAGLWSGDFLFQEENIRDRQVMINEALKQWKKGSVINIMWHACNPAISQPCGWDDGTGVLSNLNDAQWKDLLTDGTEINRKWKSMMDEVSAYLKILKDNGVEVLWRPLHEMNQGKFWWGGRPGENGTRKLYQMTHDYMTKTKGLTNLIWIWDVQDFGTLAGDVISYNPGKDYWDVAALDVYDDKSGFTNEKYNIMLSVAGGKPVAIGECDKLPTAAQLAAQPQWIFFMSWSELTKSANTDEQLKALYNDPRVVTLDEMPGWKK